MNEWYFKSNLLCRNRIACRKMGRKLMNSKYKIKVKQLTEQQSDILWKIEMVLTCLRHNCIEVWLGFDAEMHWN